MNWEKLMSAERLDDLTKKDDDYLLDYVNSQYETDYQTIINSASFRRLQDKTQVFPLDTNDFVRTRLTHSLETSFIAKKLGNMVLYNMDKKRGSDSVVHQEYEENKEFLQFIPEVLACTGLLHDMGNPPFGHFGEVIIGEWFRENLPTLKVYKANEEDKEGKCIYDPKNPLLSYLTTEQYKDLSQFEGNAQLLRVVSKLYKGRNNAGMNLTVSVLGALIKYPIASCDVDKKYEKFGYFEADQELFDEIVTKTGQKEGGRVHRHPLVYLLEAADDIAYYTADVEDALKKGTISFNDFQRYYKQRVEEYSRNPNVSEKHKKHVKSLANIILDTDNEKNKDVAIKEWVNSTRNWLMYCAAYKFVDSYQEIMDGSFEGDLFKDTFQSETVEILDALAVKYIFPDKKIMKVEISGSMIINSLLNKFVPAILTYEYEGYETSKENKKLIQLLPEEYKNLCKKQIDQLDDRDKENQSMYLKLLLVSDFISGMTDSYAKRLYFELNGLE